MPVGERRDVEPPAGILRGVILAGFEHYPGVHCGSTALANALRHRGLALSEPMAFGLGAGLAGLRG